MVEVVRPLAYTQVLTPLTNNANAGFDLKGTANTVQTGTLTATTADLQLATGDRLSLDFAGTLTDLAGLLVTVSLKRI